MDTTKPNNSEYVENIGPFSEPSPPDSICPACRLPKAPVWKPTPLVVEVGELMPDNDANAEFLAADSAEAEERAKCQCGMFNGEEILKGDDHPKWCPASKDYQPPRAMTSTPTPSPGASGTPRTIASVLESDFGFDAKEAARAGEVIDEACGISLLLKYQEHHEFVASQLSKMLGVPLRTSGDFKDLVDGLRNELTAALTRAEQAEKERDVMRAAIERELAWWDGDGESCKCGTCAVCNLRSSIK